MPYLRMVLKAVAITSVSVCGSSSVLFIWFPVNWVKGCLLRNPADAITEPRLVRQQYLPRPPEAKTVFSEWSRIPPSSTDVHSIDLRFLWARTQH